MTTYLEDLERQARLFHAFGCGTIGCDCNDGPFFLGQKCHPRASLEASYESGEGILRIICSQCRRPVANVAVASRPDTLN